MASFYWKHCDMNYQQLVYLFVLALPIACVAWTVTHEEVFKEPRDFCIRRSKDGTTLFRRKFYYLFTCEYCFSHYVTIFFLAITGYTLFFTDWRGYVIAGFALVWVANMYMTVFALLRQSLKKEKVEIEKIAQEVAHNNDTDTQ